MIDIQTAVDSLTFSVYVQPRASKAAIVGCHENELKIKLTAPPADGAANKQCCQLLAKTLSVPKTSVEIVSGHTNRHKRIRIHVSGAGGEDDINALAEKINALGGKA